MTLKGNATAGQRTLPQIGRVRRGWLFRDQTGDGWWVDDTVVASGAHRVVPVGQPSAQYRVFTPMVGARDGGRRVYRFLDGDDHRLSLATIEHQLAHAAADRQPIADSRR